MPAGGAVDAATSQNAASNTLSWTVVYTLRYLKPLDQSTTTPAAVVVNKGKNGRVIPVKVVVSLGSVQQTSSSIAQGRLTIGVNAAVCNTGVSNSIETYADAGSSRAGTNQFRYSAGSWIYNLDTKALGFVTNGCYRLDVYLDGTKISTQTYAIFQPTK